MAPISFNPSAFTPVSTGNAPSVTPTSAKVNSTPAVTNTDNVTGSSNVTGSNNVTNSPDVSGIDNDQKIKEQAKSFLSKFNAAVNNAPYTKADINSLVSQAEQKQGEMGSIQILFNPNFAYSEMVSQTKYPFSSSKLLGAVNFGTTNCPVSLNVSGTLQAVNVGGALDYQLVGTPSASINCDAPSLSWVEDYIRLNGHIPDPSFS